MTKGFALQGAISAVFLQACMGSTGGAEAPETVDQDPMRGPMRPPPKSTPGPTIVEPTAAPMPLRRLTRVEYANTVRDLLGLPDAPLVQYPEDEEGVSGFRSADRLEASFVRLFQTSAESLAATAVTRLSQLHPCDTATKGEATCARELVEGFGRRAYRRPLLPEESERLRGLYQAARDTLKVDHAEALGLVVEAMLQSPNFLYHWELGPISAARAGAQLVKLNDHELASRLSYLLWASMPDAALFSAADAGRLTNPEELRRQARRLLADERVSERFVSFHRQWLETDEIESVQKNTAVYPKFGAALAASMGQETARFVSHVLRDGDGKLGTLLTAPFSFLDERLGEVYGLPLKGQTTFGRAELPAAQRAGLLTQPAFLAAHGATNGSNPPKRGKVVVERLLCRAIPPPIGEIPPVEPPSAGKTTRERFEQHLSAEMCKGCHALLDPPGFAFEHYDGVGSYRSDEGGRAVNAAGVLETPAGPRPFKTAVELAAVLAGSAETHACYTQQWLRFGLGRQLDDADRASLDEALAAFNTSGRDVRELLIALTTTAAFRFRAASPGEVTR